MGREQLLVERENARGTVDDQRRPAQPEQLGGRDVRGVDGRIRTLPDQIHAFVEQDELLRAEIDVLAVLSNCPEALNNAAGFEPTPIRVIVYAL